MFLSSSFSIACILLILIANQLTHSKYKIISSVVLFEFVLHELVYALGCVDFKVLDGAWLYVAYASINLAAIYCMRRLLAHFFITFLFLINLSYNMLTSFAYIPDIINTNNQIFILFYGQYQAVVGTIMLLEVGFCWALLIYVNDSVRKYGNDCGINHIDNNFLLRRKHDCWRSNWAVS